MSRKFLYFIFLLSGLTESKDSKNDFIGLYWIFKRLQSRPDRVFTEGNEIEELAKAAENEEFEEIESEDEDGNASGDEENEDKNEDEEFEVVEKKKVSFQSLFSSW